MTKKFNNIFFTESGKKRAFIDFSNLEVLWINTGSKCNLQCKNCYMKSGPDNDKLAYIKLNEIIPYVDEIKMKNFNTNKIGLTGGEPFTNPQIIEIIEYLLSKNFEITILTNAYIAINNYKQDIEELSEKYAYRLTLRISIDHYSKNLNDQERGQGVFSSVLDNLKWITNCKIITHIATRRLTNESEEIIKNNLNIILKKNNVNLILTKTNFISFPEIAANLNTPEITVECWDKISARPEDIMCSNQRMIVKKKGDDLVKVISCTLMPYENDFELSTTIHNSFKRIYLNHPYCSTFCILGGASCSG